MNHQIPPFLLLALIAATCDFLCSAEEIDPPKAEQSASPLTKIAIEKRINNLPELSSSSMKEEQAKTEWLNEKRRLRWEKVMKAKALKEFSFDRGGVLYQKDFEKFSLKFGDMGVERGKAYFKISIAF